MGTPSDRVDRVLVLLDDGTGEEALEAAADLARRGGLPLVGLVVQDLDLLSSAGLPFAREIGFSTGRARPLSADEIEARMHERAERYRQTLARVGQRLGIQASLEIGRGRRGEAVLGRVHPQDVLVARRTPWAQRPGGVLELVLGRGQCAVVLLGQRAPAPAPAVLGPMVLIDGTDGASRALSHAIAFARHSDKPLALLVSTRGGDAEARSAAATALAEQGIDARFHELAPLTPRAVAAAARRERPDLLFVSRESPVLARADAGVLTDREDVPLVIVP